MWFKLGFEVYGKGTLIKHKSILKHDKKFQHRANYWMFGSNAYTFFDWFMSNCGIFHLKRIHLEATDIDDVTSASFEVNHTVFIYISEVWRSYSAILQHLRRAFRIVHISAHDCRTWDDYASVRSNFNKGVLHWPSYAAFHIFAIVEVISADCANFRSS